MAKANVFKVERLHAGIGLMNIRERVEHFGGRFHTWPERTEYRDEYSL
jgi:two-component system NarL family sensor kinase